MRVDIKYDGIINDVCGGATNFFCQLDDFVSHLSKVSVARSLDLLRKLGPGLGALRLMVKTKLKRASRDQTIASGQAIETDDGLEDR